MSKTLIYVIADYGDLHDLAFAEVAQNLYAETNLDECQIKTFAVPAFDTVATGFMLAQTAINSRLGDKHKFYVNTAPRKDDLTPRVKNSGEGLVYAKLYNGVEIVAVNSGYSLSFVKEATDEVRIINCSRDGSQFRSRDVFPPAFGKIFEGDYSHLGDNIIDHIPDIPEDSVCYTDGYGNMKCSLSTDFVDGMKGQDVIVDVNGYQGVASIADGIFGVSDGQFCISVGSSGWELPNGSKRQFVEIVKRGGSAAESFARPFSGTKIKCRALS